MGTNSESTRWRLTKGTCIAPVRYGFRSLDRQWIIPDGRVINRPNPTLWENFSDKQVFLTAFRTAPPAYQWPWRSALQSLSL